MGSTTEHQTKWTHNRNFLASLEDECCDWMVTVAFYTAVHAVEALFAKDGLHGQSHDNRNHTLKTRTKYQTIWKSFRPLYEASMVARYDCDTGPDGSANQQAGWIDASDVRGYFVGEHLKNVEALVIKLLTLKQSDFPMIFPPAPTVAKEKSSP